MVKLNLSAMQNPSTREETTNTSVLNTDISVSLDSKKETQNNEERTKKKMSLNSLISWISEETKKETPSLKEEATILEVKIVSEETSKEISVLEETNISEKVDELKIISEETAKSDLIDSPKMESSQTEVKIADWDTIWTLIVETKKEEIFWNYVSSFEKELAQFKKTKEKKESKAKDEQALKTEEVKEEASVINDLPIVSIDKKDINLDDIIDKIEVKNDDVKVKFDLRKFIFAKSFAFVFALIILSLWVYLAQSTWFVSYVKTSIFETKDGEILPQPPMPIPHLNSQEIKKDNNTSNINYESNHKEVKEKLIKYFKNKQNKDIIE